MALPSLELHTIARMIELQALSPQELIRHGLREVRWARLDDGLCRQQVS